MKLEGWPELLVKFTDARRNQPYQWGINDCVMFAADSTWAITGVDPLPELRGTWTTAEQAAAVLSNVGGLIAAMDERFMRVDKNFAQRGDVVLIRDGDGQPSLGVCLGAYAAAPGQEEMLMTSMSEALIAWSI